MLHAHPVVLALVSLCSRQSRLHLHPRDQRETEAGVEERLVRERKDGESRSEGEKKDGETLKGWLAVRAAMQDREEGRADCVRRTSVRRSNASWDAAHQGRPSPRTGSATASPACAADSAPTSRSRRCRRLSARSVATSSASHRRRYREEQTSASKNCRVRVQVGEPARPSERIATTPIAQISAAPADLHSEWSARRPPSASADKLTRPSSPPLFRQATPERSPTRPTPPSSSSPARDSHSSIAHRA